MPDLAVILPAAGLSTRFGGTRSKLFEPLNGVPVIFRALQAFSQRADVASVIVVNQECSVSGAKVSQCAGGPSRAHSVLNALREVPLEVEWVAVHDAARPLVSQGLIDRTFLAAQQYGAAAAALPVALTIKQAHGPLPAKIGATVPRDQLWAMQTPQVMRRAALLDAFERCPIPLDQVTDDVQLLELAGQDVWLIPGDEQNIKITTPMDLKLAELWLSDWRG